MTYKVVKYSTDANDNHYAYKAGDTFPRKGVEVSAERIEELATDKNKRGIPLIEAVKEKPVKTEKPAKVETVEKAEKPAKATPKKSTTTTRKKKNV